MTRLSRALILLFSTLAIQFGTVDAVADTDVTIKGKVEQTQESLGGGDDEVNFQELNIGNIKKPDATTTIIIGGNVKQTQSGQGNKQQLNIGNVDENGGSATVTIQKSLSQHQLGANNEQAINIGNVLKSKEHGGSGTTKVTVASVTQIQTGFNNKQSISVGNTYNKTTDVTVGDIIQLQEGLGKTQIINIGVSNTANTNVTVGNVTQIQTDAHSGACQEIIVGYDSIVTVGDIIQFDDMGLVSGSPRSGRIEIGNSGEIPSCDPKKIVVLDPGTDEDGFRPMPGLSYEESYVEHHPEGVKAREAAEAEAAADAKRNSFERFVHNVTKATDEAWDSVKKTWSDWRADMSVAGFFVAVGDTFIGISAEGTRAWAEAAARFASDVFNDVLGKLPLPDVAKDFLSGTFDTVLAVGLTRYNLSSHFIEGVLSGTWELILLQFHVGEWISNAIGYGLLNLLDLFIDVDQHEFLASRRDHAKKIFDEGWGTITGLASLSYNLNTNPIGTIEGLWEGIKEAFNGCSNARGTAGCVSYIVGNIVPEVVGTKGAVLAARGVASLPRVARMAEAASTAARKIKPVAKALDRYAGSGLQRAVDRVNYVVDIDFITFKNGLPRFQSFKEFSRGAEIMPPVARGIPNDNAPSTKGVYPSNIEMNEVVNNVNTPKVAEAAGRGAPPSTVAVERNSLDLNSGSGVRGPPATTYAAVGGNPTDSIRIGGSAAARSVPPSSPQHTASAATQSSTPTPQPHAAPQTPATGVQTASLDVPQGTPPKADTPTSVASTAHVPGTPEATPERAIVTRGATNERGPNLEEVRTHNGASRPPPGDSIASTGSTSSGPVPVGASSQAQGRASAAKGETGTQISRGSGWYKNTARDATKNPDSDLLVLGHFSRDGTSYDKVAERLHATYLMDDWETVTKGLTQDEKWRINETFITQQLKQGKRILFSHDPLKARQGSYFEKEVNFLRELGYSFKQNDQWTWKAVRGADWYKNTARAATKNPDSDLLVLGHFSRDGTSYDKVAERLHATYLVDDWETVTKGLTQDEKWRINETFITQQLKQGKQILFSHDPLKASQGSYFEKEVNFLRERGYSFEQNDQWTWKAVGGADKTLVAVSAESTGIAGSAAARSAPTSSWQPTGSTSAAAARGGAPKTPATGVPTASASTNRGQHPPIRIGGSAAAQSAPTSSRQPTDSTSAAAHGGAPKTPATGVQTASLDVPQGMPPKADTPTSVASTAHVPGTPEATPERAIVTRGATNERGPNLEEVRTHNGASRPPPGGSIASTGSTSSGPVPVGASSQAQGRASAGISSIDPKGINPEIVISGHGIEIDSPFSMPDRTSVVTYSPRSAKITDELGNLIETGGDVSSLYREIHTSWMNDIIIYPPDWFPEETLLIMGAPVTVTKPTRLSDILKPGMGQCHLAACRYVPGSSASDLAFDIDGIYIAGRRGEKKFIYDTFSEHPPVSALGAGIRPTSPDIRGPPQQTRGATTRGANPEGQALQEPVNINTADAAALQRLTGIGPVKANAIIEYRKAYGAFASVDDLAKVPGIAEKTLTQLKPQITVGTPSIAPAIAAKVETGTQIRRGSNWFENTARNATRNPDSDLLVLGHFASEGTSYQKVAAHYKATYFKVDDWRAVTKGLSQDEIWRINETFITQQLKQGKRVLFSHDPLKARPGSYFEKEVNFLRELGYSFKQKNQWTWEAVRGADKTLVAVSAERIRIGGSAAAQSAPTSSRQPTGSTSAAAAHGGAPKIPATGVQTASASTNRGQHPPIRIGGSAAAQSAPTSSRQPTDSTSAAAHGGAPKTPTTGVQTASLDVPQGTPPKADTPSVARATRDQTLQEPVNINTADAAALQRLTGIGPVKANAIIEYRKAYGAFASVDDLAKVPGIAEKTLTQLKPQITVGTTRKLTLEEQKIVDNINKMSRQERLNTFTDPKERAIAEYLENAGRKTGQNTLEGVAGAGRQGDSFVDGVKTEFKTLTPKPDGEPYTGKTVQKVIGRSRAGGGQAEHIIIDARNVNISEADIHRAISRYFGTSSGNLKSVEVIRIENGAEYSFIRRLSK